MQKGFLVTNKESQIANYLEHRSILKVVEEHRSLAELNLEQINIINCDKMLYIYHQTDDGDLAFRSDMNTLRILMASAFFHVDEILFVLVECQNPLLEDIINSALRDSGLTKDKITIIHHSGSLMMSDVGRYISGSAVGSETESSYHDVYIREADKEEKERYENISNGISDVLPVLTDMEAQYRQRSNVESISAGRIVTEHGDRPATVSEFSRIHSVDASKVEMFVMSGDKWAKAYLAPKYIAEHLANLGSRCLVIDLTGSGKLPGVLPEFTRVDLLGMKSFMTPEKAISLVEARYAQFGYIMQFLSNIRGIDKYIIFTLPEDYMLVKQLSAQFSEDSHSAYVTYHNEEAIQSYIKAGYKSDAVFLNFGVLNQDFELEKYKEDFSGTVVAVFPEEDADLVQFYSFTVGGKGNE